MWICQTISHVWLPSWGDRLGRFLANEAHSMGLAIGLKNCHDIIADVEPLIDWCVEQGGGSSDGRWGWGSGVFEF